MTIDNELKKPMASENSPEIKKIIEYANMCGDCCNILDVGCGFGGKMWSLMGKGHVVVGVDVNKETIAKNRQQGLTCYSTDEDMDLRPFNVLLLSHVIEHLFPIELLEMMNHYLDSMAVGSHVIIATPLLSNRFYDDFTHKRPYPIASIVQMFNTDVPVSHNSKHKLELERFWYRRNPHISVMHGGKSLASLYGHVMRYVYLLSFGYIGEADGYVALFKVIK